ncbi:MAG: hypothetical protein EOP49_07585 [Sphingobacteriales bacterium]|nr:MAG: hypothetical protein EOP49_07585 [Sphingobacteriales bacterium]
MKPLIALCSLLLSFTVSTAQPIALKLRPLEGYYVDAKYPLKKGPNFFVITNDFRFEQMFGKIDNPKGPDFELEHVVVMALPPMKRDAQLSFSPGIYKAGNYMEVYCSVKEDKKHKLPYVNYPVVVAAVPVYFSVSRINFYDQQTRELLASVPVR